MSVSSPVNVPIQYSGQKKILSTKYFMFLVKIPLFLNKHFSQTKTAKSIKVFPRPKLGSQ